MAIIEGDVPCQLMPREEPAEPRDARAIRDSVPKGSFSTLVKNPLAARLEIDDLAYSKGSAVTLPVLPASSAPEASHVEPTWEDPSWAAEYRESAPALYEALQHAAEQPESAGSEDPAYDRVTLALVAIIYRIIENNPELRLLVAGHSDAEEADGDELARGRARNFCALLTGDRELFIATCAAHSAAADFDPIGHFVAAAFGWGWRTGGDPQDALRGFRAAYNEARSTASFKSFFKQPLTVDAALGADDWGALYDCYLVVIAALMGTTSESGLSRFRSALRFVDPDHPAQAFGAAVPREAAVTWRSLAQRRVEVLFFPADLVDSIKRRGASGVYQPGLCDFLQVDPRWFNAQVKNRHEGELSVTESSSEAGASSRREAGQQHLSLPDRQSAPGQLPHRLLRRSRAVRRLPAQQPAP